MGPGGSTTQSQTTTHEEGHTGLSIQVVFEFLEALLSPYNTPQPLLRNVPSTFKTHIFLLRLMLRVEKREN